MFFLASFSFFIFVFYATNNFFFLLIFSNGFAQIGSWNILNFKIKNNKSWNYLLESQIRSLLFYNHFHYYEYKAFINKRFSQQLITSLGIGKYQTYQEGGNFVKPLKSNEIRISPQIITLQDFSNIQLEHRYRMELRFTQNGYRNRFRYRLGLKYIFAKLPFSLHLSSEIFLGTHAPYFERNRSSFLCQFKLSKMLSLQYGYLHQLDYRINDETGKNFMVFSLMLDFF